jgi:hypothetical protein
MPDPYLSILNSVVAGLVGAAVVYYFGNRRDAKQRRCAFLDRQLSEFYAPLAGLHKQIRSKSELRLKIQNAMVYGDPVSEATIDYHNKQFNEDLLPKYRQMLAIFTDRYHLANADTRHFYSTFLEFVEIWNMWLTQSLSPDVLKKLNHAEENVKSFYNNLDATLQRLQDEIARG